MSEDIFSKLEFQRRACDETKVAAHPQSDVKPGDDLLRIAMTGGVAGIVLDGVVLCGGDNDMVMAITLIPTISPENHSFSLQLEIVQSGVAGLLFGTARLSASDVEQIAKRLLCEVDLLRFEEKNGSGG